MRKGQLIQLLQFILAWVLLWLFVVFVMESSFIDFILKYRLYLLIVSVSYFYYYSIEYELDKKYQFIRKVIIYGNLYLFLHIFFRPLLNISHQLFILLWLIILWIYWTTTLKSRWRYLLQIIWWIFSFFILISGVFYFYPDSPDIDGFIKSKNNEIKILWINNPIDKREAYIKIITSKGSEDFEMYPNFSKPLSEDSKISYPSLKPQRDEKLIFISSQWDLVQIFPQSEILIKFEWWDPKRIEKLNWKIWFLSWIFKSNIEVVWHEENLTQEEQNRLIWIQDSYKKELVYYLKNQISKSNIWWASNTIMHNIDGKIIKFLAKMFPATFSKNLHNYNEFQEYFGWIDDWVKLTRYSTKQLSWESINVIRWYMKDNMEVWKANTYWWFRIPKTR